MSGISRSHSAPASSGPTSSAPSASLMPQTQSNIWRGLVCDYATAARLSPSETQSPIPFKENNSVDLEKLTTDGVDKGMTPLFEGDTLVTAIAGGGSGASIALVETKDGELLVRKFMLSKGRREAAMAQNQEAIGQATLVHKEPSGRLSDKLAGILERSGDAIEQFVAQNRPSVTKRFAVLKGQKSDTDGVTMGVGYDQTAFTQKGSKTTAPEFAKVIANKGQPLLRAQLQKLLKAQMSLVSLFETAQAQIHLEPLDEKAGKSLFYSTYLAKFEARLGAAFLPNALPAKCDQALSLPSTQGEFSVKQLLMAPSVEVNGKSVPNPLAYAHDHKDEFIAHKEGFLLHGDLQQTNAIYVDGDEPTLKCIDNRSSEVQDYLSDLSKMLWGPDFVPVMEDMLDVQCDAPVNPSEGISITLAPKQGQEHTVDNFSQFMQAFHGEVASKPRPHNHQSALSDMKFTAGIQYLRDLGFVLSRLESAYSTGDQNLIESMSRRVVADFAKAALTMSEHQAMQH